MTRKRARETLVLVGDPAVARVRTLLTSPHKRLRWEAVKTLAAMMDAPSVDQFVSLLDDQHSDIRWLAADGLIGLGPRSVALLLHALLGEPLSQGRRQMTRRVLRQLSSDNQVLAEIVGPVVEALDMETLDSGVVATKAERALNDLERVTGRLPDLGR
jgi:HEAT repeat protein